MTAKERMDPHKRETDGREAGANGPAVNETEAASDGAKGSPAEN
jgi:hypothetical protein